MEKRKNPEKELKNKQGLFFNMGLLIAMMLCVSAFEYETRDVVVSVPDLEIEKTEVYLPPVTTQDMPEPPKPKAKLPDPSRIEAAEPDAKEFEPILDIIEPEVPVDLDLTHVYIEPAPIETVPNEPFRWVEEMPSPKGGYEAFYKFIGKNLVYPPQARSLGVEGKIYAQFVINEKGELIDIEIQKGIGAGCDEEVLRILKMAPKWNPGKQRGKPVKVRTVLPIKFQMNQ